MIIHNFYFDIDFDGIQWGNNCNELNASYAADGYARMRGIGVLVTTFGVGELSAINGIAGSYAEMVSVVHIVGTLMLLMVMLVLVTTFGVGELSALNGIAGSYAEMVSVVHIVGTLPTASQASGAILHHTLGNGDFLVFANMYKEVTIAHTNLTKTNAIEEIDRVLNECLNKSRPAYIGLAVDLSDHEINVDPLSIEPLKRSLVRNPRDVH
ncbi:unnamed protein product [Rotaria socialis]|uniref:Thiamine pyrophosphate enzyme N-terminal TPP-binding domain-containing protein n=1 Tax=Rotaria socialis TaxID=392032 RepID=A0A818X3P0_9BILA|nr:unnamed protein product [Rotaria socialis]